MTEVAGYDPIEDAIRGFSAFIEAQLSYRPRFAKSGQIVEVPETLPYLVILNAEVIEDRLLRKKGPAVVNRYESDPGTSGLDRFERFDMPRRADISIEMSYLSDSHLDIFKFNSQLLLMQQISFLTTPFDKELQIDLEEVRGKRSVPNFSDIRVLNFEVLIMGIEVLGTPEDGALMVIIEQEFDATRVLNFVKRPVEISMIVSTTDPTVIIA